MGRDRHRRFHSPGVGTAYRVGVRAKSKTYRTHSVRSERSASEVEDPTGQPQGVALIFSMPSPPEGSRPDSFAEPQSGALSPPPFMLSVASAKSKHVPALRLRSATLRVNGPPPAPRWTAPARKVSGPQPELSRGFSSPIRSKKLRVRGASSSFRLSSNSSASLRISSTVSTSYQAGSRLTCR